MITAARPSKLSSPLSLLLIAYVVLATAYSVVTPIFEASDELWHYPAVKYLADHGLVLPVQDPNVQTAWRQEGSQPPLYYMLGAIVTSWIDTSDLDRVRRLNPHADIGILVPDGNVNMIAHDDAAESFPWRGAVMAVHLARFLSVALGAVTVAMTYLLTVELFPDRNWLALAAAAFTAFNPMFLFISGSVNNDNLSNALASVLLVLIVRLLKRRDAPPLRDLALIGVVTGAGLLAKLNIGFMIPLVAVALAVLAYRLCDWRVFVKGALITGILTIVVAGWWYARNIQLYHGDPTGLNVFVAIVGPRTVTPNLAQLWSERHTFLMSYWGFFGGLNVPLPDFVYSVFNGIAALAVIGLVVALVRWIRALRSKSQRLDWPILFGAAFTVIWIVVLFVSLLRWTTMTWASQGRLMFTAIASISMWLAFGLWKLGQPLPLIRRRLVLYGIGWTAVIAILGLLVISRAYANPDLDYLTSTLPTHSWVEPPSQTVEDTFQEPGDPKTSGFLRMQVQAMPVQIVHVGDYLEIGAQFRFWGAPRFTRDWTAVVHLENSAGVIVAQRDMYPRQGQLSTSQLDHDISWYNRFDVRIPDFAVAPQGLNVYLGFYDLKTGERLTAFGDGIITPDNRVLLGMVQLLPRDSAPGTPALPNPMNVNFGGEAELLGYDVSSLVMFPNKQVAVTFYWRALRPMSKDYRVFAQVLEPNTSNTFGGDDAMPAAWSRPTTTWKPGEIIKDVHTFKISPDAPPGQWQIQMGMYELTADHQYNHLRIILPDGSQSDTVALLTRIKMTLPPEPF